MVELVAINDERRESAVKFFREALADALAGKIIDAVIVAKEAGGTWYHRATSTLNIREEIGAIEMIKQERILQALRDG